MEIDTTGVGRYGRKPDFSEHTMLNLVSFDTV